MHQSNIFMGKFEGWPAVAQELKMTPESLWTAVRTKKVKAVETHDRTYIIPPDEQLRLTGRV